MKNIHLIPTDKPSKLLLSGFGTLFLTPPMRFKNSDTYQHMYITSDEEIKANEWFYSPNTNSPQIYGHNDIPKNRGFKKIILTTDQDLINDGVQAITDEFLEWFVKNPNCEEVKVVEKQHFEADESKRKNPLNGVYYSYKIIIPKEEPKQETINLDKLESQLDDVLEKEIKELLINWLRSKRNEQETKTKQQ